MKATHRNNGPWAARATPEGAVQNVIPRLLSLTSQHPILDRRGTSTGASTTAQPFWSVSHKHTLQADPTTRRSYRRHAPGCTSRTTPPPPPPVYYTATTIRPPPPPGHYDIPLSQTLSLDVLHTSTRHLLLLSLLFLVPSINPYKCVNGSTYFASRIYKQYVEK